MALTFSSNIGGVVVTTDDDRVLLSCNYGKRVDDDVVAVPADDV